MKTKWKKDPRVNAGYRSFKEFGWLFIALAVFNGFHMWIYQTMVSWGILETNIQLAINVLIVYVVLMAALITVIIACIRHIVWDRPMRTISEAAQKIAAGDFSVRIPPRRTDGKKDFMEVMFDDFNTMAGELATIETLKDDFIANVSHEIKTPLSVIQAYAAALNSANLAPEERSEYAQTILAASQKLTVLVTNILKLNKLENQTIIPEPAVYNLAEQLRRCALTFEELWEQKNIHFEADLDELYIRNDAGLLEIAWNNLLSNAVKFTNPNGRIFLGLKTREDSPNGSGRVEVTVSDTGCGIDEQTMKHIFDKFYQGDTSHAQEGNGLGLALVHKTVELAGGTITVDSAPGNGSTFTVYLKTE